MIENDKTGIYNNKEREILFRNNIGRNEKNFALQEEINNLYIKLKQINNNKDESDRPYFFKNKFAELF